MPPIFGTPLRRSQDSESTPNDPSAAIPTASGEALCDFIDASPTPYHAVAQLASRLDGAGFTPLAEGEEWDLSAGDLKYVIRDGSSMIAFRVGSEVPAEAGFRAVGAHTDSPTFKVRPHATKRAHGYTQVAVETYGGPLHHTWLDRDLTVAGRVVDPEGRTHLLRLPGAPLRIPSLAIHLQRGLYEKGLHLNLQQHLVPVWSAEEDVDFISAVTQETGVEVLGFDLVLVDTQPSALGGANDQFIFAPRQDNLVSCFSAVAALIDAEPHRCTQVGVFYDHEEIGSRSAEGAAGPFLDATLRRIGEALGDTGVSGYNRALSKSMLVSCDSAHAVHPNYADSHDADHRPRLGAGPVIKAHASQSYATDAVSSAWFVRCCQDADVAVQHYTNRADKPSGSTIGPVTATRVGIPTVDVGAPLLSMHSVREQSGTADLDAMTAALRSHFTLS